MMQRKLVLALLCGILLSLSFPPFKFGFLAYVGLIPFFLLIHNLEFKQAIKWSYITGLLMNIGTLYWINWVTIPGTIAAILYLPVFYVLFAVFYIFLRKRLKQAYLFIAIPFLWTTIEFIRSLGVLGFPWTSMAYSQTYYLSLIQYASYTSLYGISFWVVSINVVIMAIFYYHANLKRAITLYLFLIILFLFPWIYGKLIIPNANEKVNEKVRIAVIQGNIDPFLKNDSEYWDESYSFYDSLTTLAAQQNPDIIIWPETAVPTYLRYDRGWQKNVRDLVNRIDIPLMTGAHDYRFYSGHEYMTFNSVFLVRPNYHPMESYAKLHLVPFGERVPFTEALPLLKDFLESLELGEGNFSPGYKMKTFEIPIKRTPAPIEKSIRMPVVICFESMFSEIVRRFINHDNAHILGIITNDGWFNRSSAPYHHAQAAVLRAIENRISIARCANTGVSMFTDMYGRILKESPIFKRLFLIADLPLRTEKSYFSTHGHLFAITISILNLVPLIIALFKSNDGASNA